MAESRRICSECRRILPLEQFGSRNRFNDCRDCRVAAGKAKRAQRSADYRAAVQASPTRVCAQCGVEQPKSRFDSDVSRADGVFPYCKICRSETKGQRPVEPSRYQSERQAERARLRGERSAAMDRDRRLRQTFNITSAEYDALLDAQGGVCAICERPPQIVSSSFGAKPGRLAVDHDHSCCPGSRSCGECVRGLLCGHCNAAIGALGDDPKRLANAIRYLKGQRRPSPKEQEGTQLRLIG